jgi:voltage-gated potassium channel
MRVLQAKLQGHVIICGFGHSGRCAAAELTERGVDRKQVMIVDILQQRLEEAAELGYIGVLSS